MTNLTHDIQHKRADADRLPSVDEWLAAGGEIEVVTDAPRQEHMMRSYESRRAK